MSTPNLAIPHIAAAQNQKEVTANDAFDRLDEAITGRLTVDLAAGDVTLTASQFRRHVVFAAVNVASGRELILPATRRVIVVDNAAGAADLVVRQGATAVTLPADASQLLYTTGTTGGLVAVAPAAQTGGAAPLDIALYFPGQPEAAERLLKLEVARGFTLPTDLAGSRGHADNAATAEAVCTILQNGAAAGTITVAAASQDAAFALTGGLALVPGDRLELVAPATQDTTLAGLAFTRVQLRSMNQSSNNRVDVWLDDIVIADALGGQNDDFLGDLRISTLVPVADTGQKDWSPSSGSNNFSRIAEIPPDDDTSWVASATPGDRDLYTMAPLGMTPLAIRGVQQTALARKDDAGDRAVSLVLNSGAEVAVASPAVLGSSYAFIEAIHENDPATSEFWTPAAVDAVQVGQEVAP